MDLLSYLFPTFCLNCGTPGNYICKSCNTHLSDFSQQCIVCNKGSFNGLTHKECQVHTNISQIITPYRYNSCTAKILSAFKYKGGYRLTGFITKLILDRLMYFRVPKDSCITAVPLAKKRKNWRGYNQSELLAKSLSKALKIPLVNILKRVKYSNPQARQNLSQRKQNVSNAFELLPQYKIIPSIIHTLPKTIILFDDVITTGSTISEAAKPIYGKNIIGMCFASALRT